MKHVNNTLWYLSSVLVFLLLLINQSAKASTVLEVDLDDMANKCELIFEGHVTKSVSRYNQNRNNIHTYVTFEITEIIKGEYNENNLELRFTGGTVDGMTLAVSDMHFPKLGEEGVYFVESLSRKQVSPLYGWSQGHFLVVSDENGSKRVTTQDKRPIKRLETVTTKMGKEFSYGVAKGLILEDKANIQQGISVSEFKNKLRGMLD